MWSQLWNTKIVTFFISNMFSTRRWENIAELLWLAVILSLELKMETFSTVRQWIRKGLWPNQGVITPWSEYNAMAYPDHKNRQIHRATCGTCVSWDYFTHLLHSITTVLWNIFFYFSCLLLCLTVIVHVIGKLYTDVLAVYINMTTSFLVRACLLPVLFLQWQTLIPYS